jgi:hypothetical protein
MKMQNEIQPPGFLLWIISGWLALMAALFFIIVMYTSCCTLSVANDCTPGSADIHETTAPKTDAHVDATVPLGVK